MKHKLTGVVRRTVEETYDVTVEAATYDEAADIVYAVLSDYPDSELFGTRLLCTERTPVGETEVLGIFAEGQQTNDVEEDELDYP